MLRATASNYVSTASPGWLIVALLPGLAVVLCLAVFPIGLAAWTSLGLDAGNLSARHYVKFFSEVESYQALLRTLGLAAATTVVSIALSIVLGYVGRTSPGVGTAVRTLASLPLAVPVLIAAYALALFFSDNGLFNNVLVRVLGILSEPLSISYTWTGLVVACVWRFFPYTALLTINALDTMDRNIELAAASTGASPWQVFARVTAPMIAPAVLTGAILTFVSTFGTFSIPLLMGRGGDMLSVMAYRKLSGSFDWPATATIVIVMAAIQIVALTAMKATVDRWSNRVASEAR